MKAYLLAGLLFLSAFLFSQDLRLLKGKVSDPNLKDEGALPGAVVKALRSGKSAVTDVEGRFELPVLNQGDTVCTYLTSYRADTAIVNTTDTLLLVHLNNAVKLKEVEVKYKSTGTELSMLNTMKLETLNERSLMKAACCNLSESFETNPSVDVNFADAVSGAKQIQLLGLGGQYAQITKENLPYMRGLANSYGLTFIPGTWIRSIQLGKGAGSVVNGFESFSGQINTELQRSEEGDRVHLNAYGNQNGRNEYNLNLRHTFHRNFSSALLSHMSYNPLAEDHNHDHFMDIPIGKQYNFTQKNWLQLKRFEWQFGGNYMEDTRNGGQMNLHSDTIVPYLISIYNRKFDVFSKSGYIFRRPFTSIGLQLNYLDHELNGVYGANGYQGLQRSSYANFIFESYIFNSNYKYKLGASYLNDQFDETYNTLSYKRNETTTGAFGEFTYNYKERFNAIVGMRGDHDNYYGFQFVPRLHTRIAFNDAKTVLRFSGGRAWHTANVFAENMSFMASSRVWKIYESDPDLPFGLKPESGWNYGMNFTQKFKLNYKEAYITIDVYRTDFDQQVIVDADADPRSLLIYNLEGPSYSNTGQFEFGWEIRKRLFVKTAYRYVENMQHYKDGLREKALVARDRAFVNLAYETKNEHWQMDATCQYNGSKRLPYTDKNPDQYRLKNRSPEFYNVMGQMTYINKWENAELNVYIGVENALDFKQMNPIVSSDAPFSQYFDASMVWGPVYGRMLYAGLRFKVK